MQNRLDRVFYKYQKEFEDKALEVMRSGWYVLGSEVQSFEEEFAAYIGVNYCVGLASGLDALWLAFRILGIGEGDEVLVQGNTYIASVMGITINGATPIFIEPDEFFNIDADKLEEKITRKTKAVLVVHLYGQASNMKPIVEVCEKHGLRLIEDCAQSHGAKCNMGNVDGYKMTGSFGDIGCFSFYPSKNLGAFGDAGAIVTNDAEIARAFKMYRNYGSEKRYYNDVVGANSRLDELQAGLLRIRLKHMDELCEERIRLCDRYSKEIHNNKVLLPMLRQDSTSVWHQYVIRCKERDQLIQYLSDKNIGTIIHYPIPPHLQKCYEFLGHWEGELPITEQYAKEVLSLPLYNGMRTEEQDAVIASINSF